MDGSDAALRPVGGEHKADRRDASTRNASARHAHSASSRRASHSCSRCARRGGFRGRGPGRTSRSGEPAHPRVAGRRERRVSNVDAPLHARRRDASARGARLPRARVAAGAVRARAARRRLLADLQRAAGGARDGNVRWPPRLGALQPPGRLPNGALGSHPRAVPRRDVSVSASAPSRRGRGAYARRGRC